MQDQRIVWKDEKINQLTHEIAKLLSSSLKEDVWYIYSLRFKKSKQGQIIICDPSADEIENVQKTKNGNLS